MRVAIIGQQAFGKAVFEAFLARGDTVAAVFCAPETGRPDPLRLAGEAAGVPTYMFSRMTSPEALDAIRAADTDLAVMAYVTQFVSQPFCTAPKFGTIQFHPSLLPAHRGASAMSWAIISGKRKTGFSVFRPTDGLDEGPIILTRWVRIEPEDTLGSLYFGKVFPMGVGGLLEAADLVISGHGPAISQYEPHAGYEGIIGDAESKITWANHIDLVDCLIRGCDPAPAAWTTLDGRRLFLFDTVKHVARTYAEVKGKAMGQVIATQGGLTIQAQGGSITARRVRWADGKKIAAEEAGIAIDTLLGT